MKVAGFVPSCLLLGVVVAAAQLPQPVMPWRPPVGIPAPPFGIAEVAGPPTHYVDNTNPSATDFSNPNGTPTRPRQTVPTLLAAGSVVEVRGGPYSLGSVVWVGQGTAPAPVFIKGVNLPVFTGTTGSRIAAAGSYFVIDGIVLERLPLVMAPDLSNFSFRRSIVRYFSPGVNSAAIAPAGSNIVLFGNEIHNNGDPNSTLEIDIHGIKPDSGAQRIWVVDNHVHHNGGDAIQIGGAQSPEPWARYIYVGRNQFHEDRENGVDVKKARDVIVSSNVIYGYRARPSSAGEAVVVHDSPQRVWIVDNRVAYSNQGIVCSGADGYYVVGNMIDNIAHAPGDPNYDPNNIFRTAGILTYNTVNSYHVNNTLWAVDAGISYAGGTTRTEIVNNIVANLLQPTFHIAFGSSTAASLSAITNNVVDGTARIKISGGFESCAKFPACVNADPRMYDPANASFELRPDSPAIDAGMTHALYAAFETAYGVPLAIDAKGMARPLGKAFDIGALEFANGPAPPQNLRIIR